MVLVVNEIPSLMKLVAYAMSDVPCFIHVDGARDVRSSGGS
jgi:hypothetical protein